MPTMTPDVLPSAIELVAVLALLGALTVGVVSPGPSFVMVARVAVCSTRANAVGVALGMGVGALVFGVMALLGLQALLASMPTVYAALNIAGGLYLLWLGVMIFRHADDTLQRDTADGGSSKGTPARSFLVGLGTHLSNPKTAAVYASVFAALLPPTFSPAFAALLLVLVFVVEAGWYALVATVLSASAPQRAYLAWKPRIDRVAGCVMGALGLKLAADAVR
jgi:threonine/homoserine/homoserine lactone efflux protein